MAFDLLIVDDEPDIRVLVSETLRDEGYTCREAADAESAIFQFEERLPNLVILDIWLEGSERDGLEVLEWINSNHPETPVIMISGHGTIETAVKAMKMGAYDFIEKPFKADRLILMVDRAIDAARLRRENRELRRRVAGGDGQFIGLSPVITQLRAAIERVAPTESRVFIKGPAGTGKETVARLLHANSARSNGPFVILNCAIMLPDHMETELFGTEHGNPDSGTPRVVGTFEQASGGTLLLDEVADMPLETQGKMVRVLQDQSFQRVGGTRYVDVDVRVVATTNRNLEEEMAAGNFREDLFYRLNVVPLAVPPLRDRREDIPALIRHFMDISAQNAGLSPRRLTEDSIAALQAYNWPGNVRHLRNVVDWILIMAPGDPDEPIRADMLPPELVNDTPAAFGRDESDEVMGLSLRDAREVFERRYLSAQVARFGGNISRTAEFVGMERSALHRKLKSLGVSNSERLEATDA